MAELPQARLASNPLLIIAVALSAGILPGHYFRLQSRSVLIFGICLGVGVTFFSVALARKRKLTLATILLIASFFCAGLILAMIDNRGLAPNRISRIYAEGVITAGQPVELTGMVQGQPESAPDSFYLTLRAESIRVKGTERTASGTVLLLAHPREQEVHKESDALELRHGARVRVMTALDREESFRNPGVLPFTEYLERKGYDATGVIKSALLIERLDNERVFLPLALIYEWRQRLEHEFAAKFSPETAGVLDAALLGNRYHISGTIADRFRAGGTFHVLVIAGLHISFIAGVVFLFVRRLTGNRLWQFLGAATFLWAYAIAVGANLPVVRASFVFTLFVFPPI